MDTSSLPAIKDGFSVERNKMFCEWVRECVELLELLGIPVMNAKGEAEALCAQLNSEGYVDACITPDSDAFLFGAKCVIKDIKPNTREPFECYHMSDIEAGLGLKRKHLIAISLLVGNDYTLGGVLGIGVDNALRIVRQFSEDDIFERLQDIGKGLKPAVLGGIKCIKTKYGHQVFVIRWSKPISTSFTHGNPEESKVVREEVLVEDEETVDPLDGLNEPQVQHDKGDCFLLTDECMVLVQSAFPDETDHFLCEKKLREAKKKNVSEELATPKPTKMGVQRSITDFYRSAKRKPAESISRGGSSGAFSAAVEKKRQATSTSTSNLSKSVRRRLLFG